MPTGRVYVSPEGGSYRSVTSVLATLKNDKLQAWKNRVGEKEANRIAEEARTRGTAVHTIAERYLLNDGQWSKGHRPHFLSDFLKIRPFLDTHLGTIMGVELMIYSDELKAAGTLDLFAEWDGIPTIIDFKTSRRVKKQEDIIHYFLQATAYAIMIKERYGIEVPQFAILIITDNYGPQVFVKSCDRFIPATKKIFARVG